MPVTHENRPPGLQHGPLTFIRRVAASPAGEAAPPVARDEAASLRKTDWTRLAVTAASLVALAVSLLDFALIIGAVPVPIPGLRAQGQSSSVDRATYSFEQGTDGWAARAAASGAVSNDLHVFAGQGALEFQVKDLSATQHAFVYTTQPADARPGTSIVMHIYTPAGAPQLLAAIYLLDKSWAWHNGPFPTLSPGQWTAVIYRIPPDAPAPIHELGAMIIGVSGSAPYTGPLFLDSVDLRNG